MKASAGIYYVLRIETSGRGLGSKGPSGVAEGRGPQGRSASPFLMSGGMGKNYIGFMVFLDVFSEEMLLLV
jgi:hypothetical protein